MTLFKGIPKDRTNADIGWMNDKAPFYQDGYKFAAEKLSEGYEHLPPQEKDSLIFPIVFLYRHHIELSVKNIINDIRKLLKVTDGKDIGHHRILELWDEAVNLYVNLIENISDDFIFVKSDHLKKPRSIIKELNKVDGLSFSFRYPTDKKGNESIGKQSYISLNNFKNEICVVTAALENMIETICHEEDYQSNRYGA